MGSPKLRVKVGQNLLDRTNRQTDRCSGSVRMGSMGSWEPINFEKGVLERIDRSYMHLNLTKSN